jgi:very-short-patch-repair endonuclease
VITPRELVENQQKLFKHLTPSEQDFKWMLEQRGFDFVYQTIIGFYIVDFCIPSKMLIIELDGAVHNTSKDYDERRDEWLKSIGLKVVRIKNTHIASFDFTTITSAPDRPASDIVKCLAKANTQYLMAVGLPSIRINTYAKHPKKQKQLTRRQLKRLRLKEAQSNSGLKWSSPKVARWTRNDEALSNLDRMFRKGILDRIEYENRRKKYLPATV